jgi:starch phosphorylase
VPIESITNGVHVPYWTSPELAPLADAAGGHAFADKISDADLWRAHEAAKLQLVQTARKRVRHHLWRAGHSEEDSLRLSELFLEPDALTICFARRFAGYKRATFFIEDEKRFFAFVEAVYQTYGKAVQVIFAGKPHPNNTQGREQIRSIVQMARRLEKHCAEHGFKAWLVFIENYDIDLARHLVAGSDLWLSNPIRPLEASGTSGMKAAANGVLNVSIADGWAAEGIRDGDNGWLYGRGDEHNQDHDRKKLYDLLSDVIVPLYFERSDPTLNYSPRWVAMMKRSIQTIAPQYSVERMLREYADRMYLPAIRNFAKLESDKAHRARF